jgi:hypothetical protein
MKIKLPFLILLLLSCITVIKAQNVGDYESAGGGVTVDLGASTNWLKYNGTTWVAATVAPTGLTSGASITIQAGDVWQNTAAATTIPAGVTLVNNSSAALGTFTAAKLTVNGTLVYSGMAAQVLPASASFVSSTIANLTVNNTASPATNATVTVGTGTLTVTGVVTLTAGELICNTGGGSFYYKGSMTGTNGTMSIPGNFFALGAVAGQVINGNLLVNNTINKLNVATVTAGLLNYSSIGPIKISAGIGLYAGVFTLGGTLTVTGTTITAPSGSGGITAGTNMVTFNASTAQTIPVGFFTGSSVNNLTLSNASGVASAGSISIGSSLTLTGLTGSVTPLTVTGTATLSGNLAVTFSGTPTSGQTFTLISATAISGTFGGTLTLPAGYTGTLNYSSTAVTLTVYPSSNASLSGLALSTGTLSPAFDPATTSYTASVPNATSTIKITPTAADGGATIKVNGTTVASGAASGSIALAVGSNTINTVVTAHDGITTQTYTIAVTRAQAIYYSKSTGDLSSLSTYGTATDGTGTAPIDFNGSGVNATYQLANRSSYTLTTALTMGSPLYIPSGSTLDLAGNTLTITTLSGTGTLTGSNTSSLVVNGTVSGLSFATGKEQLGSLTLGSSATVTLGSVLNIASTGTVTLGASAVLNTNNTLTLKSDASGSALIAALGTDASIAGNVTAERYIYNKRAWRLITSAVNSSQTIDAAWQEGAGGTSADPNPGYGTLMIGSSTPNGFDIASSSGSLLTYDGATFSSVANTNSTTLSSNPGYFLFSIGSRGVSTTTAGASSSTVLRSTGTLLTGTQNANVTATGYTLVGNPYPAPVDFSQITRSSTVPNQFYTWDINLGTYGGYVLVSYNGSSYISVPSSPSGLTNIIPEGAAIFVQSDGTNTGTLTLNESSKATGTGSNTFSNFNTVAASNTTHDIRINLTDATANLIDGVMASFASTYSNNVDNNDAKKLPNFYENIALSRSGSLLTLERRADITSKDSILIQLSGLKTATYQLQVDPKTFNEPGMTASLEDAYLHTSTTLDLTQVSNISFKATSDTATYKNRFKITFSPTLNTVMIKTPAEGARVIAYPNPATGKQINLTFEGMPLGSYNITVSNPFGQVTQKSSMVYNGGASNKTLSADYTTGVYTVNIQSANYNQAIKVIVR